VTPPATAAARRAMPAPARRGAPAPRPARRVSGPARPVAVPRRGGARTADLPLGARALDWLRALPDHHLLDRLVGGRVWIVLMGTLLVGLVTVQLTLLRWNAGIGRAVEHSSVLEQQNAALRLSVSQMSDTERIVGLATQMGYVTPQQGSPRFLTASAGDAAKALTTMRVPDPAALAAASAGTTTTGADGGTTTSQVPAPGTTTTTPATTTTATTPATTTPSATTNGAGAPAAATTTPGAGTTPTPAAAAPAAPATPAAAGGASAPVGGQG
jgi:hypothetical protein